PRAAARARRRLGDRSAGHRRIDLGIRTDLLPQGRSARRGARRAVSRDGEESSSSRSRLLHRDAARAPRIGPGSHSRLARAIISGGMRRLSLLILLALAPAMSARAQPNDWGVQRDPFDKAVIARYKALLAQNPHDGSALAKLLEMYRRYRTVDL